MDFFFWRIGVFVVKWLTCLTVISEKKHFELYCAHFERINLRKVWTPFPQICGLNCATTVFYEDSFGNYYYSTIQCTSLVLRNSWSWIPLSPPADILQYCLHVFFIFPNISCGVVKLMSTFSQDVINWYYCYNILQSGYGPSSKCFF